MEKLTVEDILARQAVVRTATAAAMHRHRACEIGTPERLEWAFIREACRRESVRLARIAARQRLVRAP